MPIFSRDDEDTEIHVLVSYEAVKDWSDKIAGDIIYDDRFEMMYYDAQESPSLDEILDEEILPYLQSTADTVIQTDIDEDIDTTAMLGITLGAAIGDAVDTYAKGDSSVYEVLGESVLEHMDHYEDTTEWRVADAPRDRFNQLVRAGYKEYNELIENKRGEPYEFDLDGSTQVIAYRLPIND